MKLKSTVTDERVSLNIHEIKAREVTKINGEISNRMCAGTCLDQCDKRSFLAGVSQCVARYHNHALFSILKSFQELYGAFHCLTGSGVDIAHPLYGDLEPFILC